MPILCLIAPGKGRRRVWDHVRHLEHQLAACKHDRERLAADRDQARRERDEARAALAQVINDRDQALTRNADMQTLFKDLAATCRGIKDSLATGPRHAKPAPLMPAGADHPDAASAYWNGEITVGTAVQTLWNGIQARHKAAAGIGPCTPVEPIPAGSKS